LGIDFIQPLAQDGSSFLFASDNIVCIVHMIQFGVVGLTLLCQIAAVGSIWKVQDGQLRVIGISDTVRGPTVVQTILQ